MTCFLWEIIVFSRSGTCNSLVSWSHIFSKTNHCRSFFLWVESVIWIILIWTWHFSLFWWRSLRFMAKSKSSLLIYDCIKFCLVSTWSRWAIFCCSIRSLHTNANWRPIFSYKISDRILTWSWYYSFTALCLSSMIFFTKFSSSFVKSIKLVRILICSWSRHLGSRFW